MKPIIKIAPTYCKYCNSNSIDIFDQYNHPIGYNQILQKCANKEEIINELNKFHNLSYMACKKCMDRFMINWTTGIPRPLMDETIINKINLGKLD